ncbi:cytochrome P450 2J2-like isoform X2 [Stegastes partitus]|uniref:Cytochrome P450 2J2-like isoform X2 n=1 Tax=Stegastes partitus TaxID=144197 RepID=A0A9Y4JJY2_9TELE|nr:PREDICTED: cytochrome P450 2J2-like isoform X2 [Stegastes partitus]
MIFQALFDSMDISGWLLFGFALLLLIDVVRNWRPHNFPPGPWALPFVGNIFTGLDFKTIEKLAQEYGPVFSLRKGSERLVFISGYNMVKEALVNQLDSFTDRPIVPLFHETFKGIGIAMSNGYLWKKQRKFANTHLRYFGEGLKSLDKYIEVESNFLCEAFKDEQGRPFNPHYTITNAVGNIIFSVVFGQRFEYSDPTFRNILELDNDAVILAGSAQTQLYDAFPALMKRLPGPHNGIFSSSTSLEASIRREVESHKLDLDPSNPRDYIDNFLIEEKHNRNTEEGFDEGNLALCCLDLFLAGSETTSKTLQWGLIYLIQNPHIQERVQAEIDRVIGQTRQPSMADRPNLPYTDAVIHEIQRMGNIVPLNGLRVAAKDTTLGGCFIPKGTSVMPNLTSVLFDKNEWETPNTFNPEHFLDAEGRFVRREAFLPFSAGRRACLGEGLARMELFLFFVSLLQRFHFSTLDGAELSTEGITGATRTPYPFKIYAKSR